MLHMECRRSILTQDSSRSSPLATMATTPAQRERTEMRRKLHTAQHRVVDGRGGGPVSESYSKDGKPGLVQLWPQFLDADFAAAKPTLSIPDVEHMIKQRKTPPLRQHASPHFIRRRGGCDRGVV